MSTTREFERGGGGVVKAEPFLFVIGLFVFNARERHWIKIDSVKVFGGTYRQHKGVLDRF